jgi:putative FmdB family regulatory protein|tara:strand:- start:70 stop:387 length:318 start_codon:yes stop_codon:yes gene_type:complete
MPTYEYECKKCGHHFETMQSIKDDPIKKCLKEECPEGTGKGTVQRLIGGGGGLLFKGSGFYITDYRSDNYKKSAKADTASGSSSGGKSDSSSSSSSSSTGAPSSD